MAPARREPDPWEGGAMRRDRSGAWQVSAEEREEDWSRGARGWTERRPLERGVDRGGERAGERAGERGAEPLEQRLERWVSRGRDLVDGVAGTRPGSRQAERRGSGGLRRGPQATQGNGGLGAGGLNPARLGRWVEERLDWLLDEDQEDDWREPWQERPERPLRSEAPPLPERPGPLAPPPAAAAVRAAPRQEGGRRMPESNGPAGRSAPGRPVPGRPAPGRRSLEAISRRGPRAEGSFRERSPLSAAPRTPTAPAVEGPEERSDAQPEAWPDEASFSVPRWSRPERASPGRAASSEATEAGGAAPASAAEPGGAKAPPARALPRSTRRR